MLGSSWAACRGELYRGSGAREDHQAVRVALSISLFVLYILLIGIVVTVPFVCCSVRLPLSRLRSFAFFFPFLSPPQRQQSDHVVLRCQPWLKVQH